MPLYHFSLEGKPFVQKQTCFAKGHAYNPCNKEIEYIRNQIREAVPESKRRILNEPIRVCMTFYMPIPKYVLAACKACKGTLNWDFLPSKRPDIDNMAYIYTNSMKSLLYADDSLICNLILSKRYAFEPQTIIAISAIDLEATHQFNEYT